MNPILTLIPITASVFLLAADPLLAQVVRLGNGGSTVTVEQYSPPRGVYSSSRNPYPERYGSRYDDRYYEYGRYPSRRGRRTEIEDSILINPVVINSSIEDSTLINPVIVDTPRYGTEIRVYPSRGTSASCQVLANARAACR